MTSFDSFTRRNLLKAAAGTAMLAGCSPRVRESVRHIAVVGGGIVGASIAYHLAKGGARVSLLDRSALATRASRGTFAWINATWAKQPRHYHRFSQLGMAGWRRLQSDIDMPLRWSGSLEWFDNPERQLRLAEQIAEQQQWNEPARMVAGDELTRLEPGVDFSGTDQVALSPNDGTVDPVLATRVLAAEAQAHGATVTTDCAVEAVRRGSDGTSILETSCGELRVDRYVIATGADPDATRALAGIEIAQRSTPGVIVITEPGPRLIDHIVVAPGVHIHQRDDGRFVLGEQAGAPDTEAHDERLRDRPNRFPDPLIANDHARRIIQLAGQFVPGIEDAEAAEVAIGWRPLPLDGHPVIGPSPVRPEAYLAITHSGVTLAPIIGALAAQELLTDEPSETLQYYRPDRELENVRRY